MRTINRPPESCGHLHHCEVAADFSQHPSRFPSRSAYRFSQYAIRRRRVVEKGRNLFRTSTIRQYGTSRKLTTFCTVLVEKGAENRPAVWPRRAVFYVTENDNEEGLVPYGGGQYGTEFGIRRRSLKYRLQRTRSSRLPEQLG